MPVFLAGLGVGAAGGLYAAGGVEDIKATTKWVVIAAAVYVAGKYVKAW
ncbi:hypothetical protein [Pyruvatibacter mobilis]